MADDSKLLYTIYDPMTLKNISLFLQNKMNHDLYRWYPMLDRAEIMLCCSDASVSEMDMYSTAFSRQYLKLAIQRLKSTRQLNDTVSDRAACFFAYLCQNIHVRSTGETLWESHDPSGTSHQQMLIDIANLALFNGNNTIMSVPSLNLVTAVTDKCELVYLNDDTELIQKVTEALLDPAQLPGVLIRDLAATFRFVRNETAETNLFNFFAVKFDMTAFVNVAKVRDYVNSIDTNLCMKRRFRATTLRDIDRLFLMMDGRCYDIVDVALDMARRLRPDEQLSNLETETKKHMSGRIAQFLDKEANVEFKAAFLEVLRSRVITSDTVNIIVQKLFSGEFHMREIMNRLDVVGQRTCYAIFDFVGLVGYCCLGDSFRDGRNLSKHALNKLDAVLKQLDAVKGATPLGAAAFDAVPGLAAASAKLLVGELAFEGFGANLLTAYSDIYSGLGIDWPAAPFVVLPDDDLRMVLPRLQALTCIRDDSKMRSNHNPFASNYHVYGIFAEPNRGVDARFQHLMDIDFTDEFEDPGFNVEDLEAYLCPKVPKVEADPLLPPPPKGSMAFVKPVHGSLYGRVLKVRFEGERESPACLMWRLLSIPMRLQLERSALLNAAAEHVVAVSHRLAENVSTAPEEVLDEDEEGAQGPKLKSAAAWSPDNMKDRFYSKTPELPHPIPLRAFLQSEYSWPPLALTQEDDRKRKAKIMWNGKDLTDMYQRAELIGRIYVPHAPPQDFFTTFAAYFKRISQKPCDVFHAPFVGLARTPAFKAEGTAEASEKHVRELFGTNAKTTAMNVCSKLDYLTKVAETNISASIQARMDLFVLLWHVFAFYAAVPEGNVSRNRRHAAVKEFVLTHRPVLELGASKRFAFYVKDAVCAFTFPEGIVNRAVNLHFSNLLKDALLHRDLGDELERHMLEWKRNEKELNEILDISAGSTPSSCIINSFVQTKLFIKKRILYYKDREVQDFLQSDDNVDAFHFQMLMLSKANVVTNVHARGVERLLEFHKLTSKVFERLDADAGLHQFFRMVAVKEGFPDQTLHVGRYIEYLVEKYVYGDGNNIMTEAAAAELWKHVSGL